MPIVDAGPAIKLHFSEMEWTEHVVKVYPEIFRAAEKSNRWSRHHRLWIIIRVASQNGCGWAMMDDIYQVAADLDGLAPSTVRRYLVEGDGVWWDRNRGRVWFYGEKRVAVHFQVKVSRPQIMPLPRSLAGFRAACAFAFDREKPIANRTLGDGIGRTETTVKNYKKRLGDELEVRHNWRKTDVKKEIVPEGRYRTIDGEVMEQMPNSYAPLYARVAAKGQTRKVNRAVNRTLDDRVRGKRGKARYLDGTNAVNRRMMKREEGDYFYERYGDGVWQKHQYCNGQWITWKVEGNVNFFTPILLGLYSNSGRIGGKGVTSMNRGSIIDHGGEML